MEYQAYLGWGLINFEDIINALTKFKDGGWWIRKIDYKDAFHREITEGPYTEKEAKRKANNWNKFFTYKDKKITTAKAYSLKDLLCDHEKDYKYLKNHLYEEYIWRPPNGWELICLLLSKDKVLLLEKKPNMEKAKMYVLDNDFELIKHKNYEIYYKKNDYMAKEQSDKLKKLVIDYENNPEQLIWLYDTAMKRKYKRGYESIIIPYYIKEFNIDSKPYTLDYFKRLENCKEKEDKINTLLCYLKDAKRDFNFDNKNNYSIGYNFPLLFSNNDSNVKNLTISYKDKKLIIKIKDFYDKYYVELNDNYLTFNLPLNNEEDNVFNDKLIVLMLFICKTLNINEIILKDNLKEYCNCLKDDEDYFVYLNIVRYLANEASIYDEMGFREENKEKRQEVINSFKDKKIKDFIEIEEENEKTLHQLARDYLEGYCEFPYVCFLLNKITSKIYNEFNNICFEHYIDLKDFSLEKLKEKLI